ncbi:MAG: hypothetical protein WCP52_10295, partial [Bacteroidota bacterium]
FSIFVLTFSSLNFGEHYSSNNTTGNTPGVSSSYWNFDSDVLFLENESEYQSNYDFIVMVPAAVVFDINAMKSLVNYYRCAGKRFTIQTF